MHRPEIGRGLHTVFTHSTLRSIQGYNLVPSIDLGCIRAEIFDFKFHIRLKVHRNVKKLRRSCEYGVAVSTSVLRSSAVVRCGVCCLCLADYKALVNLLAPELFFF